MIVLCSKRLRCDKANHRQYCHPSADDDTGAAETLTQSDEQKGVKSCEGQPTKNCGEHRRARVHVIGLKALSNGVRLSCAALLWFSQLQFYYDGRRQLQPLVRLRTNRWSLGSYPVPEPEEHPPVLTQAPQR